MKGYRVANTNKLFDRRSWGDGTPYSVQLPAFRGYLITQPEHFGPLLRATRFLSNKKVMAELMRDVFGTPPKVMRMSSPSSCLQSALLGPRTDRA